MQFDETKTYQNLARSFAGESQAGMRYQLIARMATQQGYTTLADTIKVLAKNETVHARRFFEELNKRGCKLVAQVEVRHEMIFKYLHEAFTKGVLFSNEAPILYICSECGYMHTSTKAWDVCPLCKESQGHVELHIPFQKEKI